MTDSHREPSSKLEKNRNEDIDSKIADFMADIDEIVLGKKPTDNNIQEEKSEWKECFDETSQLIYYWNAKTNECSWDPPTQNHHTEKSLTSTNIDGISGTIDSMGKKRHQSSDDIQSPKQPKKLNLIAEYTSSGSDSNEDEENVDDIDELLNEVLDKEEKVQPTDLYPLFEADCRAAIARLTDLGDRTSEIFALRIQLETRLDDCLAGHLSKSYTVSKLEEALIQIEEFEKLHVTVTSLPLVIEPLKPPSVLSEMALLLSLPPPPPPPSPPPPIANTEDQTLQLFYAQLNCDQPEPPSLISDMEQTSMISKPEQHHPPHHHHHKDKKSKPAKTLPTDLIQKWAHARQELRGIEDIDDS